MEDHEIVLLSLSLFVAYIVAVWYDHITLYGHFVMYIIFQNIITDPYKKRHLINIKCCRKTLVHDAEYSVQHNVKATTLQHSERIH